MEDECFQAYKSLVSEITKGMEQVKELGESSSSNQEPLLERMLASYEEALSILNGSAAKEERQSVISSAVKPPDPSVFPYKGTQSEISSGGSRKRAAVREVVTFRTGSDSLDDGFKWRKYGKKNIPGSKYPRNYYRCGHEGCSAKKRVQRVDDDQSIIETTYSGTHTCLRTEPVDP